MDAPFPYYSIYFRRPFLTDENKRLWSILAVTFMVILLLHAFLMDWTANISTVKVRQNIKRNYISFLTQNFIQPDNLPTEITPASSESLTPQFTSQFPEIAAGVHVEDKTPLSLTELSQDISELVDQTNQLGFATISAAVEGVPGFTARDFGTSRPEKKLSYRNEKTTFRSLQEHIHIPVPETIQFASRNGNRDLHETMAVMEANENDIKYCFEKFARFDPSISGDVLINFTIHPDGFVIPASIRVLQSSVRDPRIIDCIRKQIRRWRNFTRLAYEDGNFSVTRKYVF